MKKLTANEIRTTWLKFWESKGHYIEPGASLVPHNDPTLLWINSGVAALKKYFDGSEMPKNKRITNVQKSIRTNDIENVGHTARHHTFFEMLGNFSIGDYFRLEMIPWAFEILTNDKYFGIPLEKLYFTYLPTDNVTKKCWMDLGVNEDHLIPLEGNFWQIGEGPCGPNTEVFFDRGEKYDPEHLGIRLLKEDLENDRYIEIWGIVFSQYNAVEGVAREDYKELPNKNIDTGAGLERIACVLQGTETNFETDLFYPIIESVLKLTKEKYDDEHKMCFRVIADHIRTCTFALSDGASFSNEGRGYVLRRILRRAMRYGRKLGITNAFLYTLVPVVVDMMKDFYPYLQEHQEHVAKMIHAEEDKFLRTLNSGESLLKKMLENTTTLSGADAFKLYDTYGFPIELTVEIAHEQNVNVDLDGFNENMEQQKERARSSRADVQSMNKQSADLMAFTSESNFSYDMADTKGKVIGLFKDGIKVDSLDDEGDVILDNTNFYAEMGGQVADTGKFYNDNTECEVLNVSKAPNKQHLHHVRVLFGELKVGDELNLSINKQRRIRIMRNHSSCHLLQAALIEVLGDHVHQQGSYVDENIMRFDFSHNTKLTENELATVEKLVNEYIDQAIEEKTLILPIEEAKKVGATALFDEKYGDVVRVVCFGDVSKEFCGGTHVFNSEDVGAFAIEYEESIASGVRRIQARTGKAAYELLKNKENILTQAGSMLGVSSVYEVKDKLKASLNEKEELKKQNKVLLDKEASNSAKDLANSFEEVKDTYLLAKVIKGNRDALLKSMDLLKGLHKKSLVILIGDDNGVHPLVVFVGPELVNSIKAGNIVKEITAILGGSGGGRPDMASGAVKDLNKFDEVVAKIKTILA